MSRITCSDRKPDRHEKNTFWLDTKTGVLYRCNGTEEYKQILPIPIDQSNLSIRIGSGQYTGDGTFGRAIAHGMGKAPKAVFINSRSTGNTYGADRIQNSYQRRMITTEAGYTCTVADATYFYLTASATQGNVSGIVYDWVAFAN